VIVLDACEAFFLRSGNNLAVYDEAGRRVVIKRRYSKNAYQLAKVTRRLEECVNKRGDCRTLGHDEQHTNKD
jgi:hypothetical protein